MAKKVLIADDEPNIVTSLEFLMEHKGYEIKIARTGDEVLDLCQSLRAGFDFARCYDAAPERF